MRWAASFAGISGVIILVGSINAVGDTGSSLGGCCGVSADDLTRIQRAIDLSAKVAGAKPDIAKILITLSRKSYEELYAIKLSDPEVACVLATCDRISGATMSKLADAILNAKEKDQTSRAANTTSVISISGAILAVLSFLLTFFNTVTAARTAKKA